jgi:hypothetical protein
MTITNIKNSLPKSINIKNKHLIKLLIHGQGVFIFRYKTKDDKLSFKISNKDNTYELIVNINNNEINIKESNNQISITTSNYQTNEIVNQTNENNYKSNEILRDIDSKYFWLSLDSQNEKLYFGIGEPRMETHTFMYNFTDRKKFLEKLVNIYDLQNVEPIKLLRDPITNAVPLCIKSTDELTMNDIAQNLFIPHASLSPTSQILYDSIAGKKFILNDKDFPDFSKAIEYSIKTPGKWCYEKLQEKSREFNKDKPNILETYLRITLGQNNGESPGVPYVMEIWPIGHYSPIHNHAGAHAIIRVLNGTINVSLFAFLGADKPFGNTNFIKDDITWISPTLNQVHQLKNLETNNETCITIQCYMYDDENEVHYDYFDYLDDKNKIHQYEPDSDMDFIKFKELMKKEWKESIFDKICFC